MITAHRLGDVANQELLAALPTLVRQGNELTAELLAYLAELDARRLHLGLGFPSLFAYCTEVLHLSEPAAGRRIAAARLCRKFPELYERIARGELHLSALCALCALGPHLTPDNAPELFTAAQHKTRRQVDELLAARFPRADVRSQIRRLPAPAPAPAPALALVPVFALEPEPEPDRVSAQEPASGRELEPAPQSDRELESAPAPAPESAPELEPEASSARGPRASPLRSATPALHCQTPVHPSRSSTPRIEPLSAERYGVHFTASAALRAKLERARDLASHRLPRGDLASVVELALDALLEKLEKQRFGIHRRCSTTAEVQAGPPATVSLSPGESDGSLNNGDGTRVDGAGARVVGAGARVVGAGVRVDGAGVRVDGAGVRVVGAGARVVGAATRTRAGSAGVNAAERSSRHVPAAVAREVYRRDGGQCSFVAPDGRRCSARALLELDHIRPWAAGGGATTDNLRLLCRAHNLERARAHFGASQTETRIVRKRRAASDANRSPAQRSEHRRQGTE